MSQSSSLLALPYIQAAQAQKHVTHNEALRILDAVVQLSVAGISNTPPPVPLSGSRWIVGTSASGAWAGQADRVAIWQDDGWWEFHTPNEGWTAWDAQGRRSLLWDGTAWIAAAERVARLGIGADASAINRLTVAAAATLLTHDGADHRLTVNKAAAGDTASLLFQTGWSGRAEMGTVGDDDFVVKVSEDATTWLEGLRIAAATGAAKMQSLTLQGAAGFDDYLGRAGAYPDGLPVDLATFDLMLAGGSTTNIVLASKANSAGEGVSFGWLAGGAYTERMRLDVVGGRLGIGTAAPSAALHVEGPVRVGQTNVASLPSAASVGAGTLLYVSDAVGGAILAFSDGTVWRRSDTRAVIT